MLLIYLNFFALQYYHFVCASLMSIISINYDYNHNLFYIIYNSGLYKFSELELCNISTCLLKYIKNARQEYDKHFI